MDHCYARDHHIADLYLLDKLEPGERSRFEEHYFDCEECLREVELARTFRGALRDALVEDAVRPPKGSRVRRWMVLAAAACLALALLPAALLTMRVARLERELSDAAFRWSREANETARRQTAELRALREPQGTVEAIPLHLYRAGPQAPPPVVEIHMPAKPAWILLLLDQEASPAFSSYRVELFDANRSVIWADACEPNSRKAFDILVHSSKIPPGLYSLQLEGITSSHRAVVLSGYSFKTVGSAKKQKKLSAPAITGPIPPLYIYREAGGIAYVPLFPETL